jgi:hypothetical protein
MPLVIPVTLVDGTTAVAADVMENFDACAAKFTQGSGGISNADIASDAGIVGTKLADNTITTAKIAEEAVTDVKLANDPANPGLDSSRAVSGDHIKTLTETHLDRILPAASLGKDKLKITVATVVVSFGSLISGIRGSTPLTMDGGPYPVATWELVGAYFKNRGGSAGVNTTMITVSSSDIATNWAFDMTVYPGASGTLTGTAVAVFISRI